MKNEKIIKAYQLSVASIFIGSLISFAVLFFFSAVISVTLLAVFLYEKSPESLYIVRWALNWIDYTVRIFFFSGILFVLNKMFFKKGDK